MNALLLQVAGTLCIAVGLWMVAPAVGVIAAGAGLLAFGLAAERSS